METIVGFIANSPEYQAFGLNVETFINLIINALSINTIVGVSKQGKQIWQEKSAVGLSGSSFSYFMFYCLAFAIYGIEKGALNMVIASLVAFAYAPVVLGVWRFGTTKEKIGVLLSSAIFATFPGIMMQLETLESKGDFVGLLLAGMLGLLVVAFEKFRRTQGIGTVNPAFSWAFLAAGVFWVPYSYKLDATWLILFNAGMAIIMSATLVLYYTRKRKLAQPRES